MALWTDKDEEAGKPKYLSTADKTNTFGADVDETNATAGIDHSGWVLRTEGTGGRTGRTTFETLVAMGSMSADGDSVVSTQTRTITITVQPQDASVTDGDPVTFTVAASVSPAGSSTLAYQWQVNDGGGYVNVVGATATSYTHVSAIAENGYLYQVTVSTDGATPVTSDPATLTVGA